MESFTKLMPAIAPILAIIGLVILESIALSKGINGVVFAGVAAAIGGLGGYEIKVIKDKVSKKKE